MSEFEVGEEVEVAEETAPEEEQHPAGSRRQRIRKIDQFFAPVVVTKGTQQYDAMRSIRDRARLLSLLIEERCPEGPERVLALQKAAEAMFWAIHAISHR